MASTRRLAAILAADVAGYSRLIGADEDGTLRALRAIRGELLDPTIGAHNGRLVKTTGDGLLVEFGSVVDALHCATEVQAGIRKRNGTVPADKRIEFRIGINVGDIVVEDGDIFGDGVNVPARLEGLAEAGGICVSARVQEDAIGKLDLVFEDLGEQALKNIARAVRAYRVTTGPVATTVQERPALTLPDKPSLAADVPAARIVWVERQGAIGALRMWAGQPEIAIEHLEAALRLSPRARVGSSLSNIGQAHFLSRRFDEAVPKLLLAIQEDPSFPPAYRALAAGRTSGLRSL